MFIRLNQTAREAISGAEFTMSKQRYSSAKEGSFKSGSASVGMANAFRRGLVGEFLLHKWLEECDHIRNLSPVDTRSLPPWECPPWDLRFEYFGREHIIDVKTSHLHGLREEKSKVAKQSRATPDLWYCVVRVLRGVEPADIEGGWITGFYRVRDLAKAPIVAPRDGRKSFENREVSENNLIDPPQFLRDILPF